MHVCLVHMKHAGSENQTAQFPNKMHAKTAVNLATLWSVKHLQPLLKNDTTADHNIIGAFNVYYQLPRSHSRRVQFRSSSS